MKFIYELPDNNFPFLQNFAVIRPVCSIICLRIFIILFFFLLFFQFLLFYSTYSCSYVMQFSPYNPYSLIHFCFLLPPFQTFTVKAQLIDLLQIFSSNPATVVDLTGRKMPSNYLMTNKT